MAALAGLLDIEPAAAVCMGGRGGGANAVPAAPAVDKILSFFAGSALAGGLVGGAERDA